MIGTRTLEAIATMPVVTKQNLGVFLGDSPVTLRHSRFPSVIPAKAGIQSPQEMHSHDAEA